MYFCGAIRGDQAELLAWATSLRSSANGLDLVALLGPESTSSIASEGRHER